MLQSNQSIRYLFNNLFILLLLFMVSLVFTQIKCESGLHEQLNYYEVIHSINIKHNKVFKRSTETISGHFSNQSVDHFVSFRAIDRDFKLHLIQRKAIISPLFNAFTVDSKGRKRAVRADLNHHYSGRVEGIDGSRVRAHIDPSSGLMTASIHTVDETYEVEPIWRHSASHRNNLSSMIVFKHSDIKHSNSATQESKHFCDFVKIDGNATNDDMETNHWVRKKRQAFIQELRGDPPEVMDEFTPAATQCTLVLVADFLFYQTMGNSDTSTTMNYMIHIIDRVNNIFNNTEWSIEENKPGFKGMGFFVKEIQIHEEPTPNPDHYNSPDLEEVSPNNLLEMFSRNKENKQFCLAHLFTHRTFKSSVLGLAYVASHRDGSVGGICSPSFQKRNKNGILENLYLNTGLTTTRNLYGQRIITREAVLVTAHELGHNWGSEHDPHTDECAPSAKYGGSYIMYTYSVTGYDDNNKFFSPCSKRSIRKVLVYKSAKCFIKPERSYCGNSIVEEGEECDEGLLIKGEGYERGVCCDNRCRLQPGYDCSDKNHDCCHTCKLKKYGDVCKQRDDYNCKSESVCDGETATCPEPSPLGDDTSCFDRGQCQGGKCISYCTSIGEETCMCEEAANACYRCCRPRIGNGTCHPVIPRDPLVDGTPCRYGYCEKQRCEKKVQDFVERFWDVIEEIDINTFIIFMKDNIVGVVIIISLIIWIPLSCAISYYDKVQAEKRRQRSASIQSDRSRRRVIRQFSRRPTRSGLVTNGLTISNQAYYPF